MTASITKIHETLKAWTPSNGKTRYYVNDWQSIIDLAVDYYNTGNVSSVYLAGEKMSNCHYVKYVRNTKVWFDEEANVHVDYCEDSEVEDMIVSKVTLAYSEA